MLLSRVADHLYWMSRYLERAEHTARLMDVSLNLTLELSSDDAERRWAMVLESLRIPAPEGPTDAYTITQQVGFNADESNSIVSCIALARENAQHVRELVSSEMWEQVNGLYLHVKQTRLDDIWNSRPSEFFRSVRDGSHLFQGITDSTMIQGEGWEFIQIGRALERTYGLSSLLSAYFSLAHREDEDTNLYLEWVGLLKSCTAFEAYCKVYGADVQLANLSEFLFLHPQFPHTLCFAAGQLQQGLLQLSDMTENHRAARLNKLAGRLHSLLEFAQVDEVLEEGALPFLKQVHTLCDQIHLALYHTYISYPVERELML
jgi:uncharacterized alpha-E superfamily protein